MFKVIIIILAIILIFKLFMGKKKTKDMNMDEYENYYKKLGVPEYKIKYCSKIRWIFLDSSVENVGNLDPSKKELHGLFIMLSYYQYQAGISDKDWIEEYMKNAFCDIGYTNDDYIIWYTTFWTGQHMLMKVLSEVEFKQKISGNFITTKINSDFCELYNITEEKLIAFKKDKYPNFDFDKTKEEDFKTIDDIIAIYEDAISIDYSIYNSEFSSLSKSVELSLENLRSNFKEDSSLDFYPAQTLMTMYFLHMTKIGGTFCNESLIKHYYRDLEERGCSKNEQPFYNIARSYWTLKVLLFDLISFDDEETNLSNATTALKQVELEMASYFFPIMGGAVFPGSEVKKYTHKERQNNTKLALKSYNVYSEDEFEKIFTQMPLYKNPI